MRDPKGFEASIISAVEWLRLLIETSGATIVAVGFCVACFLFAKAIRGGVDADFTPVRLVLARYLALALEFQLGADILSTAISPTWQQIGKLAAIAVIRTGLNFFLAQEMKMEERKSAKEEVPDAGTGIGSRQQG